MKHISQSASKIVLLMLTGALIALTASRIVEAKDFIVMMSMAYTYYFTRRREDFTNETVNKNDTTTNG